MASTYSNPPQTSGSPERSLTKNYDDDVYSSSSHESHASLRKPLSSFDDEDLDLEDGFERPHKAKSWWSWKDIMTVRGRRKASLGVEGYRDLNSHATRLLEDVYAARRRRKRNWYNYCIFSGISGLTILALLLVLNLILGLATLIWTSDFDHVLQNWGQPGTGTEDLEWYPTDFTRDILPIPCHSHNDYWRRVPLFSALRAGCTGVEADVWLFDNELYVGHNTASLTRNRTFTSLYIDPLVKILQDANPSSDFYNGTSHGVFDVDPGQTLTLLVDLKTSGAETWPWVLKQVQPLRDAGWLSFVENDTLHTRPITLVGTGNTPFDVLTANSPYRDAFFDAPLDTMWEARRITAEMANWPTFDDGLPGERLDEDEGSAEEKLPTSSSETQDLGQGFSGTLPDTQFNASNSYYASVSFGKAVGRIWRGRLSPRQMKIIRGQIRGAHRRGLKARYWDLPAWPLGLRNHVWDVLVKEGVDYLNVDDLRGASRQAW
ncbi:uncharacterized protein PAC_17559 [Phialocephala subalpina]|uniref:Altered inheritance of mitochondria protein 6 n=1 Tax=Phialocephala subalpina TaxID=576137 RepID=A0A1L7XRK1_9HELO|nr:uncharacterized protein PAC_17559 [Phialocephala subalpina]